MTTRTSVAVVIRHDRALTDGTETTAYYGPFLPHVGSACTRTLADLAAEDEDNPDVATSVSEVLTVFIAEGESDAVVVARDSL